MIPHKCVQCQAVSFHSKVQKKCEQCGGDLLLAALIHYLQPCDKEDADLRIKSSDFLLKLSGSQRKYRRVTCFSYPTAKPLPPHMTTDLASTTCFRCFKKLEVCLDELGRPII